MVTLIKKCAHHTGIVPALHARIIHKKQCVSLPLVYVTYIITLHLHCSMKICTLLISVRYVNMEVILGQHVTGRIKAKKCAL